MNKRGGRGVRILILADRNKLSTATVVAATLPYPQPDNSSIEKRPVMQNNHAPASKTAPKKGWKV